MVGEIVLAKTKSNHKKGLLTKKWLIACVRELGRGDKES